jgi:hypothetical protein
MGDAWLVFVNSVGGPISYLSRFYLQAADVELKGVKSVSNIATSRSFPNRIAASEY